jgi:hypothetical protein
MTTILIITYIAALIAIYITVNLLAPQFNMEKAFESKSFGADIMILGLLFIGPAVYGWFGIEMMLSLVNGGAFTPGEFDSTPLTRLANIVGMLMAPMILIRGLVWWRKIAVVILGVLAVWYIGAFLFLGGFVGPIEYANYLLG